MVGDLAASAIKRNQEIKDYGKLIPGHGGILDRFDSVIIYSPGYLLSCKNDSWNLERLKMKNNCNLRFYRIHRDTDTGCCESQW